MVNPPLNHIPREGLVCCAQRDTAPPHHLQHSEDVANRPALCPPSRAQTNFPHQKPQQQQGEEERYWDCLFTNDARWGRNEQGQQTINEVYVLLEEIGRGSYGRVHLCERRVGDGVDTPWRRFALKTMRKPWLRRQCDYVNVPSGGMRKVTAEDKVR